MSDDPMAVATAMTFRVSYPSASRYNRDLKGKGELVFRGNELVFSGRKRGTILSRQRHDFVVQRDQVRNVTTEGSRVEFSTPVGQSGRAQLPFVFFCADAATAQVVAGQLPTEKDAAQLEAEYFGARLNAVSAGIGRVGSVTNWIIAANVVVFFIMGLLGAGWFEPASMDPYIRYMANNGAATTDGEWWRLVSAMFTHYGILHLLLNMWALYQVGHLVEKLLSRRLFALAYFGSGIVGSLATLLWHGDKVWSAGASGAVFGVYGALLGYLWREKHGMPRGVLQPLMKSTSTFAGYNLVYGMIQPQIDNVAHVGGILGGILFGWICAMPVEREIRIRETSRRLLIGGAVLVVTLVVGIACAPRFDYVVGDELLWRDKVGERANRESALLKQGSAFLENAAKPAEEQQARRWLEHDAIPFYEQWQSELQKLPLRPGRATATRRDGLLKVLGLQLRSYRALLAAPDWNDPEFEKRQAAWQREMAAAVTAVQHGK